jgi:uncharacterized protein YecE (DUF72 family)
MDARIGCCGFPMARKAYFARFSVVEIQQTFYQPPRPETLRRMREEAPPGFEFTLKAWQLITHEPTSPTYRRLKTPIPPERRERYGAFRPTEEVFDAWHATLACAEALSARIVVFQCPASFTPTDAHIANLREFFRAIRPGAQGVIPGWEPRGEWPPGTVDALCAELGLLRVVDPFAAAPPAGGLRYFRLHGIGGYHYRYTDADLQRLLGHCRGTTYCLFNNARMAEDAARFMALARGQSNETGPLSPHLL